MCLLYVGQTMQYTSISLLRFVRRFSDHLLLLLYFFSFHRTLDDGDELAFLRVRSKKHEIMIAPDKDYILVVIQNPQEI